MRIIVANAIVASAGNRVLRSKIVIDMYNSWLVKLLSVRSSLSFIYYKFSVAERSSRHHSSDSSAPSSHSILRVASMLICWFNLLYISVDQYLHLAPIWYDMIGYDIWYIINEIWCDTIQYNTNARWIARKAGVPMIFLCGLHTDLSLPSVECVVFFFSVTLIGLWYCSH